MHRTDTPKTGTPKTDTSKSADASKAVEYDPVTDKKVRATIRTTLASQKAATEINEAFTKLRPAVQNYSRALSLWRAKGKHPDDEPSAPDFKELAKGGRPFVRQKRKWCRPKRRQDTTELGKSTHSMKRFSVSCRFRRSRSNANSPDYMPSETDSPDGEVSYLWWRTAFAASYVPAFADVKPDVLQAWKMIHARKLALAEANKYAEEANRRQSTLKEIFQIRPNMTVKDVGPFHWLSVGNMPMGDSMQPFTQITQVSGLDFADVGIHAHGVLDRRGEDGRGVQSAGDDCVCGAGREDRTAGGYFPPAVSGVSGASRTNSRNGGMPVEAAYRDSERNDRAKLGAILEEFGFKQLAIPPNAQGSAPRTVHCASG